MGGFEDKVRGVLSDTMNLPSDFLGMIPQYVAQNPVSLARTSGMRITLGTNASIVTTTGTTFGTGSDLLASSLTFTADGKTDYILRVAAESWHNSGANQQFLRINLDGADYGAFALCNFTAGGLESPLSAAVMVVRPSAGSHTVNARLITGAGTATVLAAAGGVVGGGTPILVTLEVA